MKGIKSEGGKGRWGKDESKKSKRVNEWRMKEKRREGWKGKRGKDERKKDGRRKEISTV